jgi:hypothetical protein
MATLQEIQILISQVQTNIGFYQARALDTNASSVQRAVANSQVALFASKLVELKNQEQALLASSSAEARTTDTTPTQQSFFAKNKWWFIGGGVLLVGGIATFLILRRK